MMCLKTSAEKPCAVVSPTSRQCINQSISHWTASHPFMSSPAVLFAVKFVDIIYIYYIMFRAKWEFLN